MKEADLAKRAVAWLERKGWDVYQEVSCAGGVADIVAVKDDIVWILETKTSLSFQLIDQARDRLRCANQVSVVVPSARNRSDTGRWVLKHFGIGMVTFDRHHMAYVCEPLKPKPVEDQYAKTRATKLRKSLEPEHKTFAAAGTKDGYWTPFKRTCKLALEHVRKNGACTMRELVDGIDHHYSSAAGARSTLRDRIELGVVPGLRIDRSCSPLQVTLASKKDVQQALL